MRDSVDTRTVRNQIGEARREGDRPLRVSVLSAHGRLRPRDARKLIVLASDEPFPLLGG